MKRRPDTAKVIAGLKDFQRATVDYVFDRLYGENSTRRFLVADEVGLGKTLVARGVIAKTIDHLWDKVKRINAVYICSNADIARQNVQRLSIAGCDVAAQATRLTLLPLHLHDLSKNRVNFVALTPRTSFEQSGGGGRVEERVVLYWLLDRAWSIHGQRAALYVMQDYAGTGRFEREVKAFDPSLINEEVAIAFVSALQKQIAKEKRDGKPDLRERFEELQKIFCRSDAQPGDGATIQRTQWIGELRQLLARVCLAAMEPDLIILDEFQRFKHLLEEDSEAGELARDLFNSESGQGARVLLLSATPYRGLSLHHETNDNPYEDFLALVRFLENGTSVECAATLNEYRCALPAVTTPDGLERLRKAKAALQDRLRKVIARTERLATATQRGGMLQDAPPAKATLRAVDVNAFLGAQTISARLEQGDVVEYWKSAPYLFNFMDSYALKEAFLDEGAEREMVHLVRKFPSAFLDFERLKKYLPLEASNARLRGLIDETVGRGMWRLLWMPAALNYYAPSGPYASPELQNVTKRLVFSAWHMVPRAVSSLVSYEAERRMMRASHPRGQITQETWARQRGLLRFSVSAGRLTGLPLLLLVYPCATFATQCDPRGLSPDGRLTADQAKALLAKKIQTLVQKLGIKHETSGAADERWYWLTPILLDQAAFPSAVKAWWNRPELAKIWAGTANEVEDAGWVRHVQLARLLLETMGVESSSEEWSQTELFPPDGLPDSKRTLGPQPTDLFEVLALAASAGPATVALRAYARFHPSQLYTGTTLQDHAGRTGLAFLSLFNHAEVTELVRSEFCSDAYWLMVLEYAHSGGLQAVIDEYVHLLRESLGVADVPLETMVGKISAEIDGSVALRTASLRVDAISAPKHARNVEPRPESMRIRFAMRFGDERNDEEPDTAFGNDSSGTRKERVRAAFNSPFWPFVLVSTSVGQEGLDFHHYCHAVTHWNLPSNPVDLEQREGRVHRYKGHAVRKNVAAQFGAVALAQAGTDPWETMFNLGRSSRSPGENDLVPFWLFPGSAKIERHVPALPFSREVDRLQTLRKAMAIYRMVFGQCRQEDLIEYLLQVIPEKDHAAVSAELQIDLSPVRSRGLG